MKKNYVTPEMEEFKFEMPQLFDEGEINPEPEVLGGSGTPNESGD